MIHRIDDELVRALGEHGGGPLFLEDQVGNRYALLTSDQFQRLQTRNEPPEFDPAELYPAIDEVMREDWDDPAMDVYDDYDSHRPIR